MKARELWSGADPLDEALQLLRMSGTLICRSELSAPWALELPAVEDCLMFHVVTAGHCTLTVAGSEPRVLRSGDLALVPHGDGHVLASGSCVAAARLFDLPRELVSERCEILRHGGGGAPTQMLCGVVRYEHAAAQRMLRLLPQAICIEPASAPHDDWLQTTLRLMAAEAADLRPGAETIVTRLADILAVQAIRCWIAQNPSAQTGWLGALHDRQIGKALGLMHREPARDWTLAALAAEVAMSRSAFAARFSRLVGEPALHYLTRRRMDLAAQRLADGDLSLGELSSQLGYQSEAAFNRAFKRFHGRTPGATRSRQVRSG